VFSERISRRTRPASITRQQDLQNTTQKKKKKNKEKIETNEREKEKK